MLVSRSVASGLRRQTISQDVSADAAFERGASLTRHKGVVDLTRE